MQLTLAIALAAVVPVLAFENDLSPNPTERVVLGIVSIVPCLAVVYEAVRPQRRTPWLAWALTPLLLAVGLGAAFTDVGAVAIFWSAIAFLAALTRTLSWAGARRSATALAACVALLVAASAFAAGVPLHAFLPSSPLWKGWLFGAAPLAFGLAAVVTIVVVAARGIGQNRADG